MACLRRSSLSLFLFARSFRWFVNIVKLEKSPLCVFYENLDSMEDY